MEILKLREIYSEDFVFTIFRKEKNSQHCQDLNPTYIWFHSQQFYHLNYTASH